MNLLVDRLPEAVDVNGVMTPIRTDFRIGVLFEGLMWETGVGAEAKVLQALRLYFAEGDLPQDVGAAFRAVVWFYGGGAAARAEGAEAHGRRLYDFDADAGLVFAAFWDQYGVDLQDVRGLHWWKFRAMFAGLRAEHEICRRMALRGLNLAKVEGKAERARLARLQAKVRLDGAGRVEDMAGRAGALFG